MKRAWDIVPPVNKERTQPLLGQPTLGARPSQEQQEDGYAAPAQPEYAAPTPHVNPVYAIHMGLQDKNAEAADGTQQEETPETLPKGDFSELRQMDTAIADQIIDPLRIRMKNRRIVQLTGIEIPDLNMTEPGDISVAARDYLEKLTLNKQLRLYQTKNQNKGRTNRMGYTLGHLVLPFDNEVWIQGALLSQGLARVLPAASNPEMAVQMIALEDQARAAKKGLWADSKYAVLTPENATQGLNNWGIVQGRIHGAAMSSNTLYLNFGPDWKTDFTIVVKPDIRRDLVKTGIDPMNLGGANIRVRGWIEDYNGPSIELTNAVWLEILPETSKTATLPKD